MSVTLRDVLRLPALRRGRPRVLAGEQLLDRPIRWVHSSDVRNIADLLDGGELLLTTGAGLGRTDAGRRTYVRALVARGVAGLVVETGPGLRAVPAVVVEEATAAGLPLIELRDPVPFVGITEAVHALLLNRHATSHREADQLQRDFTKVLIDGAGVADLLSALAAAVGNPVVLEKADRGVFYHAAHRTPAAEVVAAWRLARTELTADATSALTSTAAGAATAVPSPSGGAWGHLAVLALSSEIGEFDRAAMSRIQPLLALSLARANEEAALLGRERGNFFADVARDRIDPDEIVDAAAALGFHHRDGRLLPVVVVSSDTGAPRAREPVTAPVWRTVTEAMRRAGIAILHGTRSEDGDAVAVLGLRPAVEREAAMEAFAGALHRAVRAGHADAASVVVAAGPCVDDWRHVGQVLNMIAPVAACERGAPPRAWHDATTPELSRLLWNLREDRHVLQFVDQRLGALLEHDRLRAAKLLPTLEALCAHHWRKAETARALNLDRRSLYPRLERLQRVLDADLDDGDTRLGLELALRVWRLLTPRPERADAAPTEPGLSLRLAQVYLAHGASPR